MRGICAADRRYLWLRNFLLSSRHSHELFWSSTSLFLPSSILPRHSSNPLSGSRCADQLGLTTVLFCSRRRSSLLIGLSREQRRLGAQVGGLCLRARWQMATSSFPEDVSSPDGREGDRGCTLASSPWSAALISVRDPFPGAAWRLTPPIVAKNTVEGLSVRVTP